jgi:cell division protease FtsH
MEDFESARDRVMMGQLRDTMVLMDDERERVAYHESGHALLAYVLDKTDPLHKITIIPRGMALGVTMTLPEEDRHIVARQYLEDSLCMRMGGRVAELLVYGDLSTGAADDLQRNTELAIRWPGDRTTRSSWARTSCTPVTTRTTPHRSSTTRWSASFANRNLAPSRS